MSPELTVKNTFICVVGVEALSPASTPRPRAQTEECYGGGGSVNARTSNYHLQTCCLPQQVDEDALAPLDRQVLRLQQQLEHADHEGDSECARHELLKDAAELCFHAGGAALLAQLLSETSTDEEVFGIADALLLDHRCLTSEEQQRLRRGPSVAPSSANSPKSQTGNKGGSSSSKQRSSSSNMDWTRFSQLPGLCWPGVFSHDSGSCFSYSIDPDGPSGPSSSSSPCSSDMLPEF
mmetsp:Transcript_8243/g.17839  ORF Transcript_8243/g.17839 Transcript_8243/m.17839 type:complete len:236 (-) Transcript_8243:26-733(-)